MRNTYKFESGTLPNYLLLKWDAAILFATETAGLSIEVVTATPYHKKEIKIIMQRGIGFVTSFCSDDFLAKLLPHINTKQYDWIIDDVTDAFDPECYKGRCNSSEYEKIIAKYGDYQFVRIRRYPIGSNIEAIDEYGDYLTSHCSLLLLCVDGGFYEIYSKNKEELVDIQKFCEGLWITVDVITDENDDRYSFHAT